VFDDLLRRLKDRLLAPAARRVGRAVSPNAVSALACAAGLACAWCAARGAYGAGLALWLLNRLLDGFDGALARAQGTQSDFGGYLDLVLDFAVYAAVPIGLVLGRPGVPLAVAALAMLASFYVNAASWMYLAAVLERRGAGAAARGELTAVTMPAGLVAGAETVALYALFFLFPARLATLFWVVAALVLATAAHRVAWAWRHLARGDSRLAPRDPER
jgi:phosphatidylglycerophosphate synthase